MTKQEIIKLFKDLEVLLTGHFQLTSGLHSDKYLQCAKLMQYPVYTEKVCQHLAQKLKNENIETVIGPAIGGIILSYEMARALGARAIFAEKEDEKMTLRRGFTIKPHEKVLVVEDVVTTGGSVKKVINLVKSFGADVVGIAALVDRSGGKVDFPVPAHFLLELEVKSFSPKDCPLCQKGEPIIKPGSRK